VLNVPFRDRESTAWRPSWVGIGTADLSDGAKTLICARPWAYATSRAPRSLPFVSSQPFEIGTVELSLFVSVND
jgi:hypothetical protein